MEYLLQSLAEAKEKPAMEDPIFDEAIVLLKKISKVKPPIDLDLVSDESDLILDVFTPAFQLLILSWLPKMGLLTHEHYSSEIIVELKDGTEATYPLVNKNGIQEFADNLLPDFIAFLMAAMETDPDFNWLKHTKFVYANRY